MDAVIELEAVLSELLLLYQVAKADLERRIKDMALAYQGLKPEQMRDANGRYVLLDAQIEIAKVRIALVEAQRVDGHGATSADCVGCVPCIPDHCIP